MQGAMGESNSGNSFEIGVIREGLSEEVTFQLESELQEEFAGLRVRRKRAPGTGNGVWESLEEPSFCFVSF